MEKLAKRERGRGNIYRGHPLDDYKFEMKYFCNAKLEH
jgi:DNA polymerase-3 subunit alpha